MHSSCLKSKCKRKRISFSIVRQLFFPRGKRGDNLRFIWDPFLPSFLSFIVFAISKSPQSNASAAIHMHNWGERRDVTFVNSPQWTRGKMTQSSEEWSGWWSWGRPGRLQGSPAPRQMCLGVIPHPQPNESPSRCLTSRPGRHASQTHTHKHTSHAQTFHYYIREIGSTRGQAKVLILTLVWLWPKITKQIFAQPIHKFLFSDWNSVQNAPSLVVCFSSIMYFQPLFDLWLAPSENNPSILKGGRYFK